MLLKVLNKIRDFYLHAIRPKFAEGIHAEYYFNDEIWKEIKNYPKKDKVTWYVITPANYEYIKHSLGTELSKEELSKKMSERVEQMKEKGFDIELHVHFWQQGSMPAQKKRALIEEAIEWGKENSLEFRELAPGWRKVDEDLPGLCEVFNLELSNSTRFTHDFELK